MNKYKVAFVSGANRGIGYEFACQLRSAGWQVVAGYRSENNSKTLLEDSKRDEGLHPFKVDIIDEKMLKDLAAFIQKEFGRLDLLISNAAINPSRSDDINTVGLDDINTTFQINVVGQLLTSRYLYDLLRKGENPKLVNISSKAALISVANANNVPYRISKAALNMLSKIQAETYRGAKIIVVALNPGWTRTDMGGPNARLSVEESVSGMLKTIDRLSMKDSGLFYGYDGQKLDF